MRSCPDCALPLSPVSLQRPRGAVGFLKCGCGGAWFAFGQLDRLLGREVSLEALGGETSRRCPDCTLSLTPVLLPGAIPVEHCTTCRGTWLDWPDVVELRLPELERLLQPADAQQRFGVFAPEPDAPAPPPSTSGFVCAKCGQRTPFSEGNGTAKGLVCRACVAPIQPMPRIPTAVVETFFDGVDLLDDD